MITTFIIILVLTILIIGYRSGNNYNKSTPPIHNDSSRIKSIEIEDKDKTTSNNWMLQHEKNIKIELEKIDNGEYDEYRYIEFEVAGVYYRTQLAKDTITNLDVLCDISLIKESDNPYDSNAVKVVYDRKRLGYVPSYYSEKVTTLINRKLIKKVFVMDSGKDYASEYSDALFITLRIYYIPTSEELKQEEIECLKVIAEQEYKAQRMKMQVELPAWIETLSQEIKTIQINSVELRRLKDNILNSIKAYEKAIRMEKDKVADNALERLAKYNEELKNLLTQKQ